MLEHILLGNLYSYCYGYNYYCYYIRKGVTSYVLSFPGGPSSVSVFLRAGWSLGNVQQRYVFEGDGSDEYLGRTITGLPLNNCEDFCQLPPHYHTNNIEITEDKWIEYIADYNRKIIADYFNVGTLSFNESSRIFGIVYAKLTKNINSFYKHLLFKNNMSKRRYSEISLRTIYNDIVKFFP